MKYKIVFVCIHNSCRSQIAEGWAKNLASELIDVYSAGMEDYHEIKPLAVEVMSEVGIDISTQYPKLLSSIGEDIDILITMGCGVSCPYLPNTYIEDWGLEDPSGGPIEGYQYTRDVIKLNVEDLIMRIKNNKI